MNNLAVIESVLIRGDLSQLNQEQKLQYYNKVCESVGLNQLTKPFEYLKLNGKEVLYATKGATEQLRNIHKISIRITSREKIDDVYIVTAEAEGKDGRCDSSTGAVSVSGLKGDNLANAFMKAETKAKRRVTLSICGLNMLDELEVETIPAIKEVTKVTIVDSPNVSPQTMSVLSSAEPVHEQIQNPAYVIKFGKFKGQVISSIEFSELVSYANWIENAAKEAGKPMKADAQEFIQQVQMLMGNIK